MSYNGAMFLMRGNCHCINIVFELTWPSESPEIPARACSCSFCVKHGNVWTSEREGSLVVTIHDQSLVSPYIFGTRTATFHVCSRCGTVPVATSEIEGRLYAVVNVNTFANVEPSWLRHATANVEGEELDTRLARRQRNWISNVRFE